VICVLLFLSILSIIQNGVVGLVTPVSLGSSSRRQRLSLFFERSSSNRQQDRWNISALPMAAVREKSVSEPTEATGTQRRQQRQQRRNQSRRRHTNEPSQQNQQLPEREALPRRKLGSRFGLRRGNDSQQRMDKERSRKNQSGTGYQTTGENLSRNVSLQSSKAISIARHNQLDQDETAALNQLAFAKRILEQKQQRESETEDGKRIRFSASHKSTRSLTGTISTLASSLLGDYMNQPVEQYAVKSFHDDDDAEGNSSTAARRRWQVRRLSQEESNVPLSQWKDNVFRLAIPLLPLIGIELTPVIDVEVIPPANPSNDDIAGMGISGTESTDDDTEEPSNNMGIGKGIQRVFQRNRGGGEHPSVDERPPLEELDMTIQIRSLRVSLLSTEDEVKDHMSTRLRPPPPEAPPRQLSVEHRKMGNEAIGLASKLEQWLRPHLSFDASITWQDGTESLADGDKNNSDSDVTATGGDRGRFWRRRTGTCPTIQVESTVSTSLTIPPLPIPLPPSLVLNRIGSTLTKRALDIALPRFLVQLEKDFERWSHVNNTISDPKPLPPTD